MTLETPGSSAVGARTPAQRQPARFGRPAAPVVPLFLLVLSLLDLRVEIQLLFDHFTLTSLLQALMSHPLAVLVLVLQGSLWRRYGRG